MDSPLVRIVITNIAITLNNRYDYSLWRGPPPFLSSQLWPSHKSSKYPNSLIRLAKSRCVRDIDFYLLFNCPCPTPNALNVEQLLRTRREGGRPSWDRTAPWPRRGQSPGWRRRTTAAWERGSWWWKDVTQNRLQIDTTHYLAYPMMREPKTDPIPAPEPATPTVAAPAPMNLAAESMSDLGAEVESSWEAWDTNLTNCNRWAWLFIWSSPG